MNQSSYTAASVVPYKLFRNKRLMRSLDVGYIPPVHIQFIPTNKCNLGCSFCSCSNRNRTDEMDYDEVVKMITHVASLGCQSVTITGGGEPLCHPRFNDIASEFRYNDISVGLVSNGTLLSQADPRLLKWCRVSCSDERSVLSDLPVWEDVDMAFSYVLSDNPDIDNLVNHIAYANAYGFTHVRVVGDLLNPEAVPIEETRSIVEERVDDSLVIWQGRKEFTRGAESCLISLLKPLIAANGDVFACCGVQYAHEDKDLDFPESMSMGNWRDMGTSFNGSSCARCYYDNYNQALASMLDHIEHIEFV